ncbi:MAG: mechanosensitive ion channel [Lachnospiraceae bacterium]|nr:mechanosensitive ion channel [Lachnospiraceae bacterium]
MYLLNFMAIAASSNSELAEDATFIRSEFKKMGDKFINAIDTYVPRIIFVLIFIFISFKLINFFVKIMRKSMDRREVDPSVAGFLCSFANVGFKVLVLLTAVNVLGIAITSFVTLLGTAGVAIGLSLQGSLSNLAGGVLILILKPFKVGDYIKTTTPGIEGSVTSIDIFYTRLLTVDKQTVIIPNGSLSNTSVVNVTMEEDRRVDITVDIAYSADLAKAKDIIDNIIKTDDRFHNDKDVHIFVDKLADSGVRIGVHVYVDTEDFFPARWFLLEQIKLKFDEEGIEIPYQTIDINMRQG